MAGVSNASCNARVLLLTSAAVELEHGITSWQGYDLHSLHVNLTHRPGFHSPGYAYAYP
jgi:hypothetical protein